MTNYSTTTRIGITERGDAALAIGEWQRKLNTVNGVILITKNLTGQAFQDAVLRLLAQNYPFILHCTCTGWGGTPLEPNVPDFKKQLTGLKKLLDAGLPAKQAVLRIDPIFCTDSGLTAVRSVVDYAAKLGILPACRVRISIYDEYSHVKQRLKNAGMRPFYGETRFQASDWEIANLKRLLEELHDTYGIIFETCAERKLTGPAIQRQGCVSSKDCEILGIPVPDAGINPQNRYGCLCLTGKTELLSCKHRCAHQCLYCYWRD